MTDRPFNPNETSFIVRQDVGAREVINRIDSMRNEIAEHQTEIATLAGARKVVARLDAMRNEIAEQHTEIATLKATSVPYSKLYPILWTVALAAGGGLWKVSVDRQDRSDRVVAERFGKVEDRLAELSKSGVYAKGVYDVQVEKRPPAAVAREVREATALDGGVR